MNRSALSFSVSASSFSFSRFLTLCLSLTLGMMLAACGGGGGTVGLPTGTALFTNAPGTVTVAAGTKTDYTIGGGTPTYTASSSNRDVATATVGGTGLSIAGVAGGSATITVTDAAGASTSIAVTVTAPVVGTPATLFTTAAGALTVPVGGSAGYGIGGGKPPYSISSSNTAVASATVSGNNFSVSGFAPGAALIVITDAAGTALDLAVTVGTGTPTPLYTTAPSAITVGVGGTATHAVGGGRPAYSVSSSNTGVAQVTRNGNDFLITGVAAGTAQIAIVDAGGAALSVDVTVGGAATPVTALFSTAASSVVVDIGATASYVIGGGKPGYAVTSSNAAVAKVAINGNAFIVTGVSAGTAQIQVSDTQGDSIAIGVTVNGGPAPVTPATFFTTAPASASVALGGTESYALAGGRAPYAVSSSNSGVARVVLTGNTYIITGASAGTATVTAFDAAGGSVATTVTVGEGGPGTELFTTAPAAVTVAVGDPATFAVGGGRAPYSVTSANAGVAKVALVGSNFTITAVAPGTVQVRIVDGEGKDLSIAVTVPSPSSGGVLFTTAPDTVTIAVTNTATFTVGGGRTPYTVSTANANVARIAIVGNEITITAVAPGTTQVRVLDADGNAVAIAVTVPSPPSGGVLYTTAPDAVTVAAGSTASFTVGGGRAPYAVSTANASVAQVAITGNTFTITGVAAGTAQVRVIDADGDAVALAVTVPAAAGGGVLFTTAPDSVTLAAGSTAGYSVGGGTGTYNVTTSNPAVATASLAGTALTVNAVAAGTANIRISDSAGASDVIAVTVTQATASPITVNPESATGNVGDTLNFQVSGGLPGYTVTVNNTSIATVAPSNVGASGGAFVITLHNVGTTSATITDTRGQVVIVPITANQTTTILRLSPSALTIGENVPDPIRLNIFGGTGPYSVFTSDSTVSTVSVTGSVVTVNGVGLNGTRCITPVTPDGVYIPGGTYDVIITTVDNLGASATSTITIKDNGAGAGVGCL